MPTEKPSRPSRSSSPREADVEREPTSAAAAAAAAASGKRRRPSARPEGANPVWFKPLMFGFLLLGLLWIIVYYLSAGRFPIQELQSWNILVGFGIAFIGFLMTTNWK